MLVYSRMVPCPHVPNPFPHARASLHQSPPNAHPATPDTMGFAPEIMRAVKRKGYRLPTPIQRKAMPLIMQVGGRVWV